MKLNQFDKQSDKTLFEQVFTGKLELVQIPFFQVPVVNDIFIIFQQEKK